MKLWNPELQKKAEADWAALYRDIESLAASGVAPDSEPARALAERHFALVGSFTGGHAPIEEGLGKLWSDQANWPSEFKQSMIETFAKQGVPATQGPVPALLTPQADAFFKEVLALRKPAGAKD